MRWRFGTQQIAGCEVMMATGYLWLRNRGADRESAYALFPLAVLRVVTRILIDEALGNRFDTCTRLNYILTSKVVAILLILALAISCVQARHTLPRWWCGSTILFCVLIYLAFNDQCSLYKDDGTFQWTEHKLEPWFVVTYFILLTRPYSRCAGIRRWAARSVLALILIFVLSWTVESTPALFIVLVWMWMFRLIIIDRLDEVALMHTIRTKQAARRPSLVLDQQRFIKARRRKEAETLFHDRENNNLPVARFSSLSTLSTSSSSSAHRPVATHHSSSPSLIPRYPPRENGGISGGGFVSAASYAREPEPIRHWSAAPTIGFTYTHM